MKSFADIPTEVRRRVGAGERVVLTLLDLEPSVLLRFVCCRSEVSIRSAPEALGRTGVEPCPWGSARLWTPLRVDACIRDAAPRGTGPSRKCSGYRDARPAPIATVLRLFRVSEGGTARRSTACGESRPRMWAYDRG